MRRVLVPLAVAWLFLHVSVITSVTILATMSGAAAASDLKCICPHGAEHDMCPMHDKPPDTTRCRMQGRQTESGIALASMLGVALPAPKTVLFSNDVAPLPTLVDPPVPLSLSVPPDAPPPRA